MKQTDHKQGRPVKRSRRHGTPLTPEKERAFAERVWRLAEPLCQAEGLELVHVEFRREPGGRTLRIYLDRPGGVTLEDCSRISRQIGDLLDVYLKVDQAYNLEVSSPGPQRPIGRPADYERFRGRTARIRVTRALDGQKNFTGVLRGLSRDRVELTVDERTVLIPLTSIARARLVDSNGENECM